MIYFLLAVLSFTVAVGLLALCSAVFFLHRRVGELERRLDAPPAEEKPDSTLIAGWERMAVHQALERAREAHK
jgi:hypothetical protein